MRLSALRKVSLVYLLIPNLIFVAGWFKGIVSLPVLLLMIGLMIHQFRYKPDSEEQLSIGEVGLFLLLAVVWTFLTGTAGLSFQIIDYQAHNIKLYDLYKNPWPTYFPELGQYACYYFGYYIVPAAISKLLGYLSEGVLIAWTVAGYWLALMWLYMLVRKRLSGVMLVLFLGGVGHLLKVIFYLIFTQYNYHTPPFYLEIWALFDQSRWVTNQVIPIIIITSILLYDLFTGKKPVYSFFPITLCFIWAIFPGIVFVLLYGVLMIQYYFIDRKTQLNLKTLTIYFFTGLSFLPAFFFLSSSGSTPLHGFIWQYEPRWPILAEYAVGTLIDLVLFYLMLRMLKEVTDRIPYNLALLSLGLLFVISLYRLGYWNDWFIRGYNPLMCIVLIVIVRRWIILYENRQIQRSVAFYMVAAFMGLGVFLPASHIVQSLKYNQWVAEWFPEKYPFTPYPYDRHPNIYQAMLVDTFSGEIEAGQYVSRKGSFYEKYLARPNPLSK